MGSGSERADRTEVYDVAREFGGETALENAGDLHVLTAEQPAELRRAGHFVHEAHAARAMDAAGHDGGDEGAEILVGDGALVLVVASAVAAVSERLVLQVALAALVADGAVERMVDKQELHDAFAGAAHEVAVGAHLHAVGGGHGAGGDGFGRAFELDEAHPAIAGDGQPFVIAEAWDLAARALARPEQRGAGFDHNFEAVHRQRGHRRSFMRRASCGRGCGAQARRGNSG